MLVSSAGGVAEVRCCSSFFFLVFFYVNLLVVFLGGRRFAWCIRAGMEAGARGWGRALVD